MTPISTLLRSTLIAGLALAPVAALAQTAETPETPKAGQDAAAAFSDSQLQSFVAATLDMQEVRKTFIPQLQAAESEADKQEIAQEANAQMVAAVEKAEGIDLETYNQIGRAAQADQTLNARIVAMVQEAQSGPSMENEG